MPIRVLVPFDNLAQLQETLCEAIELAERLVAELIILRVNLPARKSRTIASDAQLYQELKALHAQCAGSPIPLRIEVMAGPTEQAILHFAAAEGIDLIVSTHMNSLLEREKQDATESEVVRTRRAVQPSMPLWQPASGSDENRFAAMPVPGAAAQPLP